MRLLKKQLSVAKENLDKTVFLEGVSGTGKTTAAIERVKQLVRDGTPADSILVLVPQAALAQPYRDAFRRARVENVADVRTATFGSLANQMIDLFWPVIAEEVGFENPQYRPHFLSLELVQYYMTRFVRPQVEANDYFHSVHISRNRLYTQIADNLNKSAVVGFPYDEIAERLKAAWVGDVEQAHIYDDAQKCAIIFREMCRRYNLLDFSLQVILFTDFIWKMQHPRRYLTRQYRHLIVDNLEEDNPAAHDVIRDWLSECDSALLIYDAEGGYRRFLGADPVNAYKLKSACEVHVTLDNPRTMSDPMEAFQIEFTRSLNRGNGAKPSADARQAFVYPAQEIRYVPTMLDWVADQIAALIKNDGVQPKDIVVLSATLPDALRFSLQTRLDERDIPSQSYRPSRALRDEPAARTLLTLAKLAHPQWGFVPDKFDVAFALTSAIADLDWVRARLLADNLYQGWNLLPFDQLQDADAQNRVTFELGGRYTTLQNWLDRARIAESENEPLPLDVFFSKLFGEVLSQPGFGFHGDFDAANTSANLIESAKEFRYVVGRIEPDINIAQQYIDMVDQGVIANQYVREPEGRPPNAVLIAPAYTFLMKNAPIDYQFWINVGSANWGQRLYQPLTQPYVLSRQWDKDRQWTDSDEVTTNQETLYRVASGLIRRCRKRVYLGFSQFGEEGFEQRGTLLNTLQIMLRRLAKEGE